MIEAIGWMFLGASVVVAAGIKAGVITFTFTVKRDD